MIRALRVASIVLLAASLGACAAKAQVRTEIDVPPLDPPPPPPRVVAEYTPEPEPVVLPPVVEPSVPARPPVRPPRPEQKPEPATPVPDPAEAAAKPPSPPLTMTPTPGSEAQTVAAIRDLLGRAARDLSRVNAATLNNDGRAQHAAAKRFLEQAEEALKVRNIVFAGKLADKAATMAAVLVR